MRYKLKRDDAFVRYSPTECRVFDVLRSGSILSTKRITLLAYSGRRQPMNALTTINGTLRSLQRKVIRNKERFRLKRSERKGPYPIMYWVVGL